MNHHLLILGHGKSIFFLRLPYFLNNSIYLFLAALGLHCFVWTFLQLQSAGAALHCSAQASLCNDFSCCGAQARGCRGFRSCRAEALEHSLSTCNARALELTGSAQAQWSQLTSSGLKAQQLWRVDLVAQRHAESSRIRD